MIYRIKNEIAVIIVVLTALIFISGGALYVFEKDVNDDIAHYGDALWLAAATASSVGYGDVYPVSPEGKVLASVLGFSGLLLIGATSALFTSYLLADKNK